MTPEQKEAFRREVLEEAAKVADHCEATGVMGAKVVAAAVRALAASQPAPAADTGQAVDEVWNEFEDDHDLVREGHRHIRYRECRQAFEAAWPDAAKAKADASAVLAAHPAPLDSERVREAAQALMDTVDTIYRDGRYVQPSIITATAGLRAALRRKDTAQ